MHAYMLARIFFAYMEEYVHVGQGRKPSYKLKTIERVGQNSS